MKKMALSLVLLAAGYCGANAQNTFPATGRAGIYTTAPAASLQVRGGARIGTLTNYTNIDSATGNLSFLGTSNYLVQNNQFAFRAATASNIGLFFNQTNTRIEFRTSAGTSVFNVGVGPSSNFVGIGNATPLTLLANTSSNIIGSDAFGTNSNTLSWVNNAQGYTLATFNASTTFKANGLAVKCAGNSGRLLDLSVGATQTAAGTPVMVVEGNGYVGIGTPAPVTTLDVKESGWFRNNPGGLLAPSAGAGLRLTTENNIASIFGYDYSTNTALNLLLAGSGGNVGIGTGSPQHQLSVGTSIADAQVVSIRGYSNTPGFWKGGAAFGYNQASVIMGELDSVATIGGHNADLSAWANLAINPDGGNVGIGIQTPVARLDVLGNVKIKDGTEGAGKVLTSDANGLASWQAPAPSPAALQTAKDIADLKQQIAELKAVIASLSVVSSGSSSNAKAIDLSNAASLKQNAPNPFSASTVINFSLPKQYANAQIIITDMNGQTIKQANVSGSNSLTVAAGSLASGSYKYSLVVDGKMMGTKTMVITK